MSIISRVADAIVSIIVIDHIGTLFYNSSTRDNPDRARRSILNRLVDRTVDHFKGH